MAAARGRVVYRTGPDGPDRPDGPDAPEGGRRKGAAGDPAVRAPAAHALRVRPERAGRKGKTVTVCGPLHLGKADAAELLRALKKRCGAGGALRADRAADGAACWRLELQGDRVDAVLEHLAAAGYPAKRSGG